MDGGAGNDELWAGGGADTYYMDVTGAALLRFRENPALGPPAHRAEYHDQPIMRAHDLYRAKQTTRNSVAGG